MADISDTLKDILGDDAEDKIRNIMGSLSDGGGEGKGIDTEYIDQMRRLAGMLDSGNDSRARLLQSLKPYMRDTRKRSIDTAIRLLNISKLAGLMRKQG